MNNNGAYILNAVWGSSAGDVFAVGNSGTIRHYGGSGPNWTVMTSNTIASFHTIWGTGPKDVFAGADDGIYHYDGTSWSPPASTPSVYTVFGYGPSDVWAIVNNPGGPEEDLYHYDGASWTDTGLVGSFESGVATAPNEVLLLHDSGRLYRWDGTKLTTAFTPVANLRVLSSSQDRLFMAGDEGTLVELQRSCNNCL
jgi:hypothetical protein